MSPSERRRSSGARSLVGRAGDAIVRISRNQSQFSVASSALAGVLVLTLLSKIFDGQSHSNLGTLFVWLAIYTFFMIFPLARGKKYRTNTGLVFIAYMAFWTAYSVTNAVEASGFLNALLEAPMMGLYLGWFYRDVIARLTLLGYLVILSIAVLVAPNEQATGFSVALVLAYAVLIAGFCLETGAHLNRRSLYQSMVDPLTQTLNRRGLNKFGQEAIARALAAGGSFSFFVIDFDNFKAINDGGGHAAGDEALQACSESWLNASKAGDLVARLGGDEFALLIHGDPDAACARVMSLRAESRYAWSWGHIDFKPGDTLDSLMLRADQELLRQKRLIEGPSR